MKKEIDYTDVGTFPKFAKAVIALLMEILKYLMKRKDPPVLSIKGRGIFLAEHVMKIFGFSVRTNRRLRNNDDIEFMISRDGRHIFYYEDHIDDYITANFYSSRSPEGIEAQKLRAETFKNPIAKMADG